MVIGQDACRPATFLRPNCAFCIGLVTKESGKTVDAIRPGWGAGQPGVPTDIGCGWEQPATVGEIVGTPNGI
jgi:hypothetical protein